ncbi:hypothetical protein ACFQX4_23745 [Roseomonas sp. GCM10028921]
MRATPKNPDIHFLAEELSADSFLIAAAVGRALRKHGVPPSEIDAFYKEALSSDFKHVLVTAMELVGLS